MENSSGGSLSLWARRQQLPSLPAAGAVASVLLLCLIASFCTQLGVFALPAAVLAGAILGSLLLLRRTLLSVAAILPVIGAVILFAPDILSAVLTLVCIPLGIAAAAAVYRGMSRMAASVLAAVSAGGYLIIACGICLVLEGMTAAEGAEAGRTALYGLLCSLQFTVPGGGKLAVFSPEAAETLLTYLIPVFPAIVSAVLFLVGCAVCGIVLLIITALGARQDFFPAGWPMRAGKSCGVIWCTAQVLLLLAVTTPNARPMYYAVYNIVIVFMIPLALTGLAVLFGQLRSMENLGTLGRVAIVFLMVMVAAAGLYWFFTAAALYGNYIVFRRRAGGE